VAFPPGSRDDEAFVQLREALAAARRDGRTFGDVWTPAIRSAGFTDDGREALAGTRSAWARAFVGRVTPTDQAVSLVAERVGL
jgi:hypothetical protein